MGVWVCGVSLLKVCVFLSDVSVSVWALLASLLKGFDWGVYFLSGVGVMLSDLIALIYKNTDGDFHVLKKVFSICYSSICT